MGLLVFLGMHKVAGFKHQVICVFLIVELRYRFLRPRKKKKDEPARRKTRIELRKVRRSFVSFSRRKWITS